MNIRHSFFRLGIFLPRFEITISLAAFAIIYTVLELAPYFRPAKQEFRTASKIAGVSAKGDSGPDDWVDHAPIVNTAGYKWGQNDVAAEASQSHDGSGAKDVPRDPPDIDFGDLTAPEKRGSGAKDVPRDPPDIDFSDLISSEKRFDYAMDMYNQSDFVGAFRVFSSLAEKGDARAQTKIGEMFVIGLGITRSHSKAQEWFEKAAAAGDVHAMSWLGDLSSFGHGAPQDYVKARGWYEKAAAGGYASAMWNLGYLYNAGLGVPVNHVKARTWWEKAAAKGNVGAMSNLGDLYASGQGCSQNYTKAREWYE